MLKTAGGQDHQLVVDSCGKVKVFLRGAASHLTWVNLVFAVFSTLSFIDLVFIELDLNDLAGAPQYFVPGSFLNRFSVIS